MFDGMLLIYLSNHINFYSCIRDIIGNGYAIYIVLLSIHNSCPIYEQQ